MQKKIPIGDLQSNRALEYVYKFHCMVVLLHSEQGPNIKEYGCNLHSAYTCMTIYLLPSNYSQ